MKLSILILHLEKKGHVLERCLNNNFLCLKKEKEKWWFDLFKQLNFKLRSDQIESKSLGKFLSRKSYVSGDNLTKDDIKVYAAVLVTLSPVFASGTTPFLPNSLQGLLSHTHSLSLIYLFIFFCKIKCVLINFWYLLIVNCCCCCCYC